MLISIILFSLFVLFFIILPSKFILKSLHAKRDSDPIINLGIDLIFGIIFLVSIMGIICFSGFKIFTIWFLIIPSLIYLYRYKLNKKLNNNFFSTSIVLLVILIGVVSQCLVLFRGGSRTESGLVFPSVHDNMWNIAIIDRLFYHFPPENPAISGVYLKNHHYFYMFFLALVNYVTKIDIFYLYYRLGPILISFVYGLGIYTVSSIFTKRLWVKCLTIFLGYYSGNFAYLVPLFLGANFDWKGNTFFMDQPFDQIFNPYSVLGFALLLFSIYALYQATCVNRKLDIIWSIIAAMIVGVSYGFKSFGGIIAFLALFVSSFFFLFKEKDFRLTKIMFISLVFFMPTFFLLTKLGETNFYWFPGWILTEMMIGHDKLNLPIYAEIENYYKSINNIIGLLKIKFIELFIYIIGNLGVRVIGFFYLFKHIYGKKNNIVYFYTLSIVILSLFIPLLFNLGSNAYNIVQFSPYALVILAIFTGITMEELYYFFDKIKLKKFGFLTLFIMLILSVTVNVKNILGKLDLPKDTISFGQLEAFNYLRNNTNPQDMLIINPKQFDKDPIYIAALSGKRIYLASPGYARQTGENPDEKIKNIDRLYYQFIDVDFLKNNGISYILLLKELDYAYSNKSLLKGVNDRKLESIFENNEVIILKVI